MKNLTDEDFSAHVLESDQPAVVLLGMDGCSPCSNVKTELSLLERLYGDTTGVFYAEKSAAPASHTKYAHGGVPVVLLFNDGIETWRKRGGSVTAAMVAKWIDDLLETP